MNQPIQLPEDYPVRLASARVDPIYDGMLKPQSIGWLGSDGAHSFPLSQEKNLWLFGDTLVGTVTEGKRDRGAAFIHNTIGIQDRTAPPPGNMTYHWYSNGTETRSFFLPRNEKMPADDKTLSFLWPVAGVLLEGELFVFAYRLKYDERMQSAGIGNTLVRVANPQDPPEQWQQKGFDLGFGTRHLGFISAVYVEEPYAYFLGFDDPDGTDVTRRAVLARARTADLMAGGLGKVFEFWVESDDGPVWGSNPENLATLFAPGVTETDIHYEKDWGLYIASLLAASPSDIRITVAPSLTGPWSEPVTVYRIPDPGVPFPNTTYAARTHPELSTRAGEIVLTYATNFLSGDGIPAADDHYFTREGLGIYWPRFVRLQLELNPTSAENPIHPLPSP